MKKKCQTIKERVEEAFLRGQGIGYHRGVADQKKVDEIRKDVVRERHLRLVEQTSRNLGQAMDAMAHALKYITDCSFQFK